MTYQGLLYIINEGKQYFIVPRLIVVSPSVRAINHLQVFCRVFISPNNYYEINIPQTHGVIEKPTTRVSVGLCIIQHEATIPSH